MIGWVFLFLRKIISEWYWVEALTADIPNIIHLFSECLTAMVQHLHTSATSASINDQNDMAASQCSFVNTWQKMHLTNSIGAWFEFPSEPGPQALVELWSCGHLVIMGWGLVSTILHKMKLALFCSCPFIPCCNFVQILHHHPCHCKWWFLIWLWANASYWQIHHPGQMVAPDTIYEVMY